MSRDHMSPYESLEPRPELLCHSGGCLSHLLPSPCVGSLRCTLDMRTEPQTMCFVMEEGDETRQSVTHSIRRGVEPHLPPCRVPSSFLDVCSMFSNRRLAARPRPGTPRSVVMSPQTLCSLPLKLILWPVYARQGLSASAPSCCPTRHCLILFGNMFGSRLVLVRRRNFQDAYPKAQLLVSWPFTRRASTRSTSGLPNHMEVRFGSEVAATRCGAPGCWKVANRASITHVVIPPWSHGL